MHNAASEAALTEQLEPHAEVVREYTIFSAVRQICANSRFPSG
jgi:hypothetical protein